MLKSTRREFLLGSAASALLSGQSKAWTHGSKGPPAGQTAQRTNINVPHSGQVFLNAAKNWYFNVDPTNVNADGYPVSVLSTAWVSNPDITGGYYGSWDWSWSGTMSMDWPNTSVIVLGGGTAFGLAGSTGDLKYGSVVLTSQTNPHVTIQFGWNIQSIGMSPTSNGSGGNLIRLTMKTGWVASDQFGGASSVLMQVSGAASNTGANGIWSVVDNADGTTLDLLGSTFTNSQASPAGVCTWSPQGGNFRILPGGTLTSPSNLVFCKTADWNAVQAGQYWDGLGGITDLTTLVGQFKDVMNTGSGVGTPGWLRFMDLSQVMGNFEKDFSQRLPVTAQAWASPNGRFVPNYWTGAITHGANDAYSCSDVTISVWSGTDYIDGAVIQGSIAVANGALAPTLAVGGHPAVPVFISSSPTPLRVRFNNGLGTGTIAATGSSYNSSTGIVSLTLSAALIGSTGPAVGDTIIVSGISGTGTDIGLVDGTFTATTGTTGTTINFSVGTGHTITTITGGNVADQTAATGQSVSFTFSASWLNGGSPYTTSFPGQPSDTDPGACAAHMANWIMGSGGSNFFQPAMIDGSGNFTVLSHATVNASTSSYNSSSGLVTLSLSGQLLGSFTPANLPAPGDTVIISLSGTGSVASLNGTFTAGAGTGVVGGVQTITYTAATGLTLTITGGDVYDETAAVASEIVSVNRTVAGNGPLPGTIITSQTGPKTFTVNNPHAVVGMFFMGPEPVLGAVPVQSVNLSNGTQSASLNGPTRQAGALSVTAQPSYTTTGTISAGQISVGNWTFVYNYLLKGFIAFPNGLGQGTPIEAIVQLCNAVGASMWWNWSVTAGASWIQNVTNYVASNLNTGLKFGTEFNNEDWNFGLPPTALLQGLGSCFGWSMTNAAQANLSFQGMRTKQFADISRAQWATSGRAASDHYVLIMNATFDFGLANPSNLSGGAGDTYINQGRLLNGTNWPYFASYAGVGGGAPAGNFDTYPNRPIDSADSLGYAPYWGSPWWGGSASNVTGSVFANGPMLQASLDYANGSTATAFLELVNQFNGTTTRPDGSGPVAQVLGTANPLVGSSQYYRDVMTGYEALAAQYDGTRPSGRTKLAIMNYEGAPQWGTGSNGVNGVNSINVVDIGALSSRIVSLGWNVSSYTQTGSPTVVSGTYDNTTGQVVLTLSSPIKFSAAASFNGQIFNISNQGLLFTMPGVTGSIASGQVLSGAHIPAGVTVSYPASGGYLLSQLVQVGGFFTGTSTGTTSLTAASFNFQGVMTVGLEISGTGVPAGTTLTAIPAGGGPGVYTTSQPTTVSGTTVSAFEPMTSGDSVTISGLTGTGAVSSLNGTFTTSITTSGTTLSYIAASGLGAITITGGTVYDATAAATEVATNIQTLGQAWKNDPSYATFIETSFYKMLASISGVNREIHPGQYAWSGSSWGVLPDFDYTFNNPYQNYYAIKNWNAGN